MKKTIRTAALALATAFAGVAHAQYVPPIIDETPGNTVTTTNTNTNNNSNVANGGNATSQASANGGNSSNSVSFRSFVAGNAPGLTTAVDGCMAANSWSAGVGTYGASIAGGKTKSSYNTDCATVQAALSIFSQANGNPELQTAALVMLGQKLPAVQAALEETGARLDEVQARCGNGPTSALAAFRKTGGCANSNTTAPTAGTAVPTQPAVVTVTVVNQGPAQASAAAAPRSTGATGATSGARKPAARKPQAKPAAAAPVAPGCVKRTVTTCPAAPGR